MTHYAKFATDNTALFGAFQPTEGTPVLSSASNVILATNLQFTPNIASTTEQLAGTSIEHDAIVTIDDVYADVGFDSYVQALGSRWRKRYPSNEVAILLIDAVLAQGEIVTIAGITAIVTDVNGCTPQEFVEDYLAYVSSTLPQQFRCIFSGTLDVNYLAKELLADAGFGLFFEAKAPQTDLPDLTVSGTGVPKTTLTVYSGNTYAGSTLPLAPFLESSMLYQHINTGQGLGDLLDRCLTDADTYRCNIMTLVTKSLSYFTQAIKWIEEMQKLSPSNSLTVLLNDLQDAKTTMTLWYNTMSLIKKDMGILDANLDYHFARQDLTGMLTTLRDDLKYAVGMYSTSLLANTSIVLPPNPLQTNWDVRFSGTLLTGDSIEFQGAKVTAVGADLTALQVYNMFTAVFSTYATTTTTTITNLPLLQSASYRFNGAIGAEQSIEVVFPAAQAAPTLTLVEAVAGSFTIAATPTTLKVDEYLLRFPILNTPALYDLDFSGLGLSFIIQPTTTPTRFSLHEIVYDALQQPAGTYFHASSNTTYKVTSNTNAVAPLALFYDPNTVTNGLRFKQLAMGSVGNVVITSYISGGGSIPVPAYLHSFQPINPTLITGTAEYRTIAPMNASNLSTAGSTFHNFGVSITFTAGVSMGFMLNAIATVFTNGYTNISQYPSAYITNITNNTLISGTVKMSWLSHVTNANSGTPTISHISMYFTKYTDSTKTTVDPTYWMPMSLVWSLPLSSGNWRVSSRIADTFTTTWGARVNKAEFAGSFLVGDKLELLSTSHVITILITIMNDPVLVAAEFYKVIRGGTSAYMSLNSGAVVDAAATLVNGSPTVILGTPSHTWLLIHALTNLKSEGSLVRTDDFKPVATSQTGVADYAHYIKFNDVLPAGVEVGKSIQFMEYTLTNTGANVLTPTGIAYALSLGVHTPSGDTFYGTTVTAAATANPTEIWMLGSIPEVAVFRKDRKKTPFTLTLTKGLSPTMEVGAVITADKAYTPSQTAWAVVFSGSNKADGTTRTCTLNGRTLSWTRAMTASELASFMGVIADGTDIIAAGVTTSGLLTTPVNIQNKTSTAFELHYKGASYSPAPLITFSSSDFKGATVPAGKLPNIDFTVTTDHIYPLPDFAIPLNTGDTVEIGGIKFTALQAIAAGSVAPGIVSAFPSGVVSMLFSSTIVNPTLAAGFRAPIGQIMQTPTAVVLRTSDPSLNPASAVITTGVAGNLLTTYTVPPLPTTIAFWGVYSYLDFAGDFKQGDVIKALGYVFTLKTDLTAAELAVDMASALSSTPPPSLTMLLDSSSTESTAYTVNHVVKERGRIVLNADTPTTFDRTLSKVEVIPSLANTKVIDVKLTTQFDKAPIAVSRVAAVTSTLATLNSGNSDTAIIYQEYKANALSFLDKMQTAITEAEDKLNSATKYSLTAAFDCAIKQVFGTDPTDVSKGITIASLEPCLMGVCFKNDVESNDLLTLQLRHGSVDLKAQQKTIVVKDARAIVDLNIEVGKRPMLTFKYMGNIHDTLQMTEIRAPLRSQKANIMGTTTAESVRNASLSNTCDTSTNNVCLFKASMPNFAGYDLQRILTGCGNSFNPKAIPREFTLEILMEKADTSNTISFNVEDSLGQEFTFRYLQDGRYSKTMEVTLTGCVLKGYTEGANQNLKTHILTFVCTGVSSLCLT